MISPPAPTLRVGIVPYLNMLPLVHGMEKLSLGNRKLQIAAVPPSSMTRMMDAGELDLGMLPVGALVERRDWPVVGQSMIGSDGPVRSVLIGGWGDPSGWRRLYPDAQSKSSNLLARVLLERFLGLPIQMMGPTPIDDSWNPPDHADEDEAFVLIGTRALRWRYHWNSRLGTTLDMGEEWRRRTGLPFVFAVWVTRPELDASQARIPEWMKAFEDLKTRNLPLLPEIVKSWPGLAHERQTPQEALEYLTQNIKFDFDARAKAGLDRFLEEASMLPTQPVDSVFRSL